MSYSLPRLATAVAVSASLANALLVSPGSPCSTSCGNVLQSTSPDEMVCSAGAYSGTSAGVVFQNCVKCETGSTYTSGSQSDLSALLYNIRVNVGYCLFGDLGNKNLVNNPCITRTACEPFKNLIAIGNYSKSVGTYDYCNNWNSPRIPSCTACLNQLDGGYYLANYMTMLEAGCEQRPGNGSTLSISGSPFDTTPVVITTPSPTASIPEPDYGPVSLGARVGIAFGGLAFILMILGCCVVCNGKRRRRAFLRDLERRNGGQGWPHPKTRYANTGEMLETPASQKPLTGWDESPISAHPDSAAPSMPRYFSPYSSTFNSPTSATGGAAFNWPTLAPQRLDQLIQEQSPAHGSPPPAFTQWPSPTQEKLMLQMHNEKRQNEIAIGLALGGDEASLRSKNSNGSMNNNPYTNGLFNVDSGKGKKRDETYEMHEVESPYSGGNGYPEGYRMPAPPDAPVLHHPGYGRHHVPSRSNTGGLTEQDMRNGNVL